MAGDARTAMPIAARITVRFAFIVDLARSFLSPLRRYVARDAQPTRQLRVTKLCSEISCLQRFDAVSRPSTRCSPWIDI
jgi:hypothetical protein